MSQSEMNEKSTLIKSIWKRKLYYLLGYILGFLIGLLNIALGAKIGLSELIVLPLSLSFLLGYLLYLIFKEPDKLKQQGRTVIFSRDGLLHFALCLSGAIISGLLFRFLK
jgi:uncharacterized membrane protein YadS